MVYFDDSVVVIRDIVGRAEEVILSGRSGKRISGPKSIDQPERNVPPLLRPCSALLSVCSENSSIASMGKKREFVDCIDGQNRFGNAGDATLIYRRAIVPLVVIMGPINLPVDGIHPVSVPRAVCVHSGIQFEQLREIAAV